MKRRNSKIDKIVGPKFKEIRKEAQVSLNELAQKVGVVSPSTLSRWERGEEGLPVEIFEKLLTSMNISYDEIVASEVDIKEIIAQVELAYQTNDIKELKRISLDLLAKYDQTGDGLLKTEYLLKSAIAANYYLDLSGDDLTNTEYKTKLSEQFIHHVDQATCVAYQYTHPSAGQRTCDRIPRITAIYYQQFCPASS